MLWRLFILSLLLCLCEKTQALEPRQSSLSYESGVYSVSRQSWGFLQGFQSTFDLNLRKHPLYLQFEVLQNVRSIGNPSAQRLLFSEARFSLLIPWTLTAKDSHFHIYWGANTQIQNLYLLADTYLPHSNIAVNPQLNIIYTVTTPVWIETNFLIPFPSYADFRWGYSYEGATSVYYALAKRWNGFASYHYMGVETHLWSYQRQDFRLGLQWTFDQTQDSKTRWHPDTEELEKEP